tara:strand:- start:268 stop:1206 length:939 start_codon:yes stop_codon:yes gene_type:complete
MRNHVSKVLVGTATANVTAVNDLGPADCPAGAIIAFDYDTNGSLVAASVNIGFAKADVLGQPIIAGPIPKAGITSAILNPYKAPVQKKVTLTVSAVPVVDKDVIIKVAYHDNLSIIPNQIKQSVIVVRSTATNIASTTTWAAAISAEFNLQVGNNLFVAVTTSTNTVVFESIVLLTASAYNGIDRPEIVNFEIGHPVGDSDYGTYTQVDTTAIASGQGTPAHVAWMEDQAMGRQGFSDRRLWNDTKKYQTQAVAGETYATLVITADIEVEGDMQGTHKNPIGAVLCGDSAVLTTILTDLALAGVVPVTVAAG